MKAEGASPLMSIWDVVHHDAEGMILNWHYSIPDGIAFDAPEAVWYAGSEGLAAGTYHILIGTAYGTGWQTTRPIQFTLSEALDAGDQIHIECGQKSDTDPSNGRTLTVYAKGSTVAKQTTTTSSGTGGTSLGTIAPESANKTSGQFNSPQRIVYGYNRWSQSAHRQFYNSTAAAGAWWKPQNPWDRPPAQLATTRGFLAGYGEDFLSILEPVDVVTVLNNVEGFTEATETTRDKIFLPSLVNWNITPQLAGEGEEWAYYVQLARELGVSGRFDTGSANTFPELIKYRLDAQASPVHVFLRSCNRSGASTVWYMTSAGYAASVNAAACTAYRGCPACKIRKS